MSDRTFDEFIRSYEDSLAPCTQCGRERESTEHVGCPYCMTPYPKDSILSSLIDDPINYLVIPPGILRYVTEDGRFKTVKDVYLASLEDLQSIHMVGNRRSRILRNIAEEYIS